MKSIFVGLSAIALMMGVYQNCSEPSQEPGTFEAIVTNLPLEQTHQILFKSRGQDFEVELVISLTDRSLFTKITDGNGVESCQNQEILDDVTLQRIRSILSDKSVCTPGPLPPGLSTCMAIAMPDIFLALSGSDEIQLAPQVCHSGVWLCSPETGKQPDSDFRALLKEIALAHPCR